MNPIFGFDFSINKPAACFYQNNKYIFYSWPFDLSEKLKKIYRDAGVNLIDRDDKKYKGKDSSEKMRWEVSNSMYLSNLIITSLPDGDISKWQIVFEGLSFNSSGNMGIQLGSYKYMIMRDLFDNCVPFENMTTYSPITIKKTAGCSQKGKNKKDMIDAFVQSSSCDLAKTISSNSSLFQKKTGTWIEHLDDLVDSYWAVETYLAKN